MKHLRKKIEATLAAVTFAEANEPETALNLLRDSRVHEEETGAAVTSNQPIGSTAEPVARGTLETHFMAAAFAEAGEFESARAMLPGYSRRKTVLLAIEGENPKAPIFAYAVSLCRRIDGRLHILQVIPQGGVETNRPSASLSALLRTLESDGIPFTVTCRTAQTQEILYDHLRNHRDVVTAVIDSPSLRNKQAAQADWSETFRKIAKKLSVPLVTALRQEAQNVPVTRS
jgi:hypothetical protein